MVEFLILVYTMRFFSVDWLGRRLESNLNSSRSPLLLIDKAVGCTRLTGLNETLNVSGVEKFSSTWKLGGYFTSKA